MAGQQNCSKKNQRSEKEFSKREIMEKAQKLSHVNNQRFGKIVKLTKMEPTGTTFLKKILEVVVLNDERFKIIASINKNENLFETIRNKEGQTTIFRNVFQP